MWSIFEGSESDSKKYNRESQQDILYLITLFSDAKFEMDHRWLLRNRDSDGRA